MTDERQAGLRRELWCERNESSASAHGHTDDCYRTLPAPDERQTGLREALPRAINFRFLPPRPVDDGVWDEIAGELVAALAVPAPAQEERLREALVKWAEGWDGQAEAMTTGGVRNLYRIVLQARALGVESKEGGAG